MSRPVVGVRGVGQLVHRLRGLGAARRVRAGAGRAVAEQRVRAEVARPLAVAPVSRSSQLISALPNSPGFSHAYWADLAELLVALDRLARVHQVLRVRGVELVEEMTPSPMPLVPSQTPPGTCLAWSQVHEAASPTSSSRRSNQFPRPRAAASAARGGFRPPRRRRDRRGRPAASGAARRPARQRSARRGRAPRPPPRRRRPFGPRGDHPRPPRAGRGPAARAPRRPAGRAGRRPPRRRPIAAAAAAASPNARSITASPRRACAACAATIRAWRPPGRRSPGSMSPSRP